MDDNGRGNDFTKFEFCTCYILPIALFTSMIYEFGMKRVL